MPGLSFLFKKGWHPLSLENQKKVYNAEQNNLNKIKKEIESKKEIENERILQLYELNGDIKERDPRNYSLKFMYQQPKLNNNKNEEEEEGGEAKEEKNEIKNGRVVSQYLGKFN